MIKCRFLAWSLLLAAVMAQPAAAGYRVPPIPGECGSRCGLVPDGQGGYIDCGLCTGVCGDTICQAGIGETHANCPADCPAGACQSEGCQGRCGLVRDQCGRLINCGPCAPVCGDGICDPPEWNTCIDDCGSQCSPIPVCGLRCGLVDDGCGFYIDCGPCNGQCGNGACEVGESNATCPEDCPAPGCVSTGCNGGCGSMVDNCGQLLSCGTCGGSSQCPQPNGVCEPDLGEDPLNCKFECPVGCGDGICTPAERLRCPSDCAGALPPDGISAGGPYAGMVGEAVHFYGLVAPAVSASSYLWTFGDGASATGLAPVHTYSAPGSYEVAFAATLVGGGELRSLTSATVQGQANTSGFDVSFEMRYDPFADAITARSAIAVQPGGPSTSPKTPLTAITIWNPAGQIVDQTGWMPSVAEADPVFVPALARPTAGLWRGEAAFGYVDAADPVPTPHPLGSLRATALVPSSQCAGCLTVAPSSATIRDGNAQGFTATPNSSPPPESVAWSHSKPGGSSSAGSVEFTGTALNVSAKATWFAQPDQRCVSRETLAAQAFTNAKYTISAAAQAGSQISTGQAELTVQMPWGIAAELGGTENAAVTLSPRLVGNVLFTCPPAPSPTTPCRVTGNTFQRTQPVVCWAETQGDPVCDQWQNQFELMPPTSSFRNKTAVHENVHVEQFKPGKHYGDLWTVDGPNGLMSYTVPGTATALRDLTASSSTAMHDLIAAAIRAWERWSTAETEARRPGSEPEAYGASDGIAPAYLLESCDH